MSQFQTNALKRIRTFSSTFNRLKTPSAINAGGQPNVFNLYCTTPPPPPWSRLISSCLRISFCIHIGAVDGRINSVARAAPAPGIPLCARAVSVVC